MVQQTQSTGSTFRGILSRWSLAFTAVPFALLVVLARWLSWKDGAPLYALDTIIIEQALASTFFICALLLSGVLSDYKEVSSGIITRWAGLDAQYYGK